MSEIIQIGEYQLKSKPQKFCEHLAIAYDTVERVLQCDQCGQYLDPFETLIRAARQVERERGRLKWEREKLAEAQKQNIHLLAAKEVEKAWRRRKYVPTCPHCREAIFPDDGFGRSGMSREIALKRRAMSHKRDAKWRATIRGLDNE